MATNLFGGPRGTGIIPQPGAQPDAPVDNVSAETPVTTEQTVAEEFGVPDLPDFIALPDREQAQAGSGQSRYRPPSTSQRDFVLDSINIRVLNSASNAREWTTNNSAKNTFARMVFGEVILGGKWLFRKLHNDMFTGAVCWGMGQNGGVQQMYMNDVAPPGEITFTHYDGHPFQGIDPTLAAAEPGFNLNYVYDVNGDDIPLAYTVFEGPITAFNGFPRWTALFRGLEVNGNNWSSNPGHVLSEFIENTVWGMGKTLASGERTALVNHCSQQVGGEDRCSINMVLDTRETHDRIIEKMRAYAECWVIESDGEYKFILDAVRSHDKTLQHARVANLQEHKPNLTDAPNTVECYYTNTNTVPWREDYVVSALPSISEVRVTKVRMPGIQSASQAKRFATQTLNKITQSDLRLTLDTTEDGLERTLGDVVRVNHPSGLVNKEMRVVGVRALPRFGYRLTLEEYAVSIYSSEVVTTPSPADSAYDGPNNPPPMNDVTFLISALHDYGLHSMQWLPSIAWQPVDWPHLSGYYVELHQSDNVILVETYPKTPNLETFSKYYPVIGLNDGTQDVTLYISVLSTTGIRGPVHVEVFGAYDNPVPPKNFSSPNVFYRLDIFYITPGDIALTNMSDGSVKVDWSGSSRPIYQISDVIAIFRSITDDTDDAVEVGRRSMSDGHWFDTDPPRNDTVYYWCVAVEMINNRYAPFNDVSGASIFTQHPEVNTDNLVIHRDGSGNARLNTIRAEAPTKTASIPTTANVGIAFRENGGTGVDNTVEFQDIDSTIEWLESGGLGVAVVQHLSVVMSGTTLNVAISDVDIRNSYILISSSVDGAANASNEFLVRHEFTSVSNNIADQVTLIRHASGGNVTVNLQIISQGPAP